jgi:predicted enzyme related to lactoylglutathione lyase
MTRESPTRRSSSLEPNFEGMQPILPVKDLKKSVDYYVDALGFKLDFLESIASVSRGRCALFLVQGDQGNPGTWVWIGVHDVDAIHREYLASGGRIRQPPTNFPWAYEMQVEDFDGNVLRVGSEPKPDWPFGPWRDMREDLWTLTNDRWTKTAR